MFPAGPMDVWNIRLNGNGSERTLPVLGAVCTNIQSGRTMVVRTWVQAVHLMSSAPN